MSPDTYTLAFNWIFLHPRRSVYGNKKMEVIPRVMGNFPDIQSNVRYV